MGLPDSREHTYGANEPVRSTDLNAIQDAIIGMKKPKHWVWFMVLAGQPGETAVTIDAAGATATANTGFVRNTLRGILEVGDYVYTVKSRFFGSAATGNSLIELYENRDNAGTLKATLTIVDPPASWADYSQSLGGTPLQILDGRTYSFDLTFGKTGRAVSAIGLEIGRP